MNSTKQAVFRDVQWVSTEGGGGRAKKRWIPELKSCCCLFPLSLGVRIIAFSELLICSFLFLYTILEMNHVNATTRGVYSRGEILNLLYTALVDILFAVYLLIGIYFKKPHYAKVWCAAQGVHLLVSVLLTLYTYLTAAVSADRPLPPPLALQLAEFTFTTCLDGYFILVVFSYYRECRTTQELVTGRGGLA